MHKLTYNLTFIEHDEPLSASKSETFETIKEAQDRADDLEIEYEGNPFLDLSCLQIDGESYMTSREQHFWNELDNLAEGKPNGFFALLN